MPLFVVPSKSKSRTQWKDFLPLIFELLSRKWERICCVYRCLWKWLWFCCKMGTDSKYIRYYPIQVSSLWIFFWLWLMQRSCLQWRKAYRIICPKHWIRNGNSFMQCCWRMKDRSQRPLALSFSVFPNLSHMFTLNLSWPLVLAMHVWWSAWSPLSMGVCQDQAGVDSERWKADCFTTGSVCPLSFHMLEMNYE